MLFDQPLVVNPLRLAFGNRPFIENYEWKPERGSRFLIIDREAGELRATVEADAFFTFHQANAFEEDGELVVDLVAFDDASIIDALYLDKLRAGIREASAGHLRRYRLPLDGGRAQPEELYDEPVELPRIAYRSRSGRPYRYVYAVAQHGDDFFDSLVKVDVRRAAPLAAGRRRAATPASRSSWRRPGADAEDDGVVLSVVLDAAAERSFLLVLDARELRGAGACRGAASHTLWLPRRLRETGGIDMCGHRNRYRYVSVDPGADRPTRPGHARLAGGARRGGRAPSHARGRGPARARRARGAGRGRAGRADARRPRRAARRTCPARAADGVARPEPSARSRSARSRPRCCRCSAGIAILAAAPAALAWIGWTVIGWWFFAGLPSAGARLRLLRPRQAAPRSGGRWWSRWRPPPARGLDPAFVEDWAARYLEAWNAGDGRASPRCARRT